jgi:hypothetical protein
LVQECPQDVPKKVGRVIVVTGKLAGLERELEEAARDDCAKWLTELRERIKEELKVGLSLAVETCDKIAGDFGFSWVDAKACYEIGAEGEQPDAQGTQSRWYDPYHIVVSTAFALEMCHRDLLNGRDKNLLVLATLLHDQGYYAVTDKSRWTGKESRTIHMQEGAASAAEWLCGKGLQEGELGRVVGAIAVHDNPYIGFSLGRDDVLRKALRDCDRVWVMHALSFYKDWYHGERDYSSPGMGIEGFLRDRAIQFLSGKAESLFGPLEISQKDLERNAQRIERPFFELTERRVCKLVRRRLAEVSDKGQVKDDLAELIDKDTRLFFEAWSVG